MAEPKKDASSSANVPVRPSGGGDPMNDTKVIAQSVSDNLEELHRLKVQVRAKHETARLKADRCARRATLK